MATSTSSIKTQRPQPAYRRVVVKAGTNVLTAGGQQLDRPAMAGLATQIASIREIGCQVILVTSGAVAAGREVLAKSRDAKGVALEQMLAAIGQSRLMHAYQEMFGAHGVIVAQALLTHADVEGRRGYLNVRNTLQALLANGVVPIVNENDVVETEEISEVRFGDNDTLSAVPLSSQRLRLSTRDAVAGNSVPRGSPVATRSITPSSCPRAITTLTPAAVAL